MVATDFEEIRRVPPESCGMRIAVPATNAHLVMGEKALDVFASRRL